MAEVCHIPVFKQSELQLQIQTAEPLQFRAEKKDFFDKIEKGVTNDKTGDGQNQGSNKGKQV